MMKGKNKQKIKKRGKFKRIKKDYQHKSLHNPFFHSKKNKKESSKGKRLYIFIFSLLALVVAVMYILFFSNFFKLQNLNISGLSRISQDTIKDFVFQEQKKNKLLIFSQDNLLFLDNFDLAKEIKSEFKLESVVVSKKYFHSLKIEIEERPLSFIWQEDSGQVFSDARGCLIHELVVNPDNSKDFPILKSNKELDYINERDCIDLDEQYFTVFLDLYTKIKEHPSLKPIKFILSSERNSLTMDLENGPNIIFNTKEDLIKQINKLLIIQQEQESQIFLALDYIDLRFGDLIYFK